MERANDTLEGLKNAAEPLLNAEITAITQVGGGGNSRVYQLTVPAGRSYALKVYFRHFADKRDRMQTEFDSLFHLWNNGIRNIPRPVIASPENDFAIYGWIEGRRIHPKDITDATIGAASGFLARLEDVRRKPGCASFRTASEACFSGPALLENIQRRLEPLLSRKDKAHLQKFLSCEFIPSFSSICAWSRKQAGPNFDTELHDAERILSPSDFGFHNALRRENDEIVFLDFEYFGWDDPAKTISDFLLHPAMTLSSARKYQFAEAAIQTFSSAGNLAQRVKAFYPLFGMKWCLILLNEFLPEQLLRRRFAGIDGQAEQKQSKQLEKAENKLSQTLSEYEHFPYLN